MLGGRDGGRRTFLRDRAAYKGHPSVAWRHGARWYERRLEPGVKTKGRSMGLRKSPGSFKDEKAKPRDVLRALRCRNINGAG